MNKTNLLFVVAAVVLLLGLFWAFKPQTAALEHSAPQAYAFTIRGGEKTAGPDIIDVAQGTELRLIINSDQPDELHVHGYDLSRELPAGQTVNLAFTAERSGRFAIELHAAHNELTTLQVKPR